MNESDLATIAIRTDSHYDSLGPATRSCDLVLFALVHLARGGPPVNVSSTATSLSLRDMPPLSCIASRTRWSMNHAVF